MRGATKGSCRVTGNSDWVGLTHKHSSLTESHVNQICNHSHGRHGQHTCTNRVHECVSCGVCTCAASISFEDLPLFKPSTHMFTTTLRTPHVSPRLPDLTYPVACAISSSQHHRLNSHDPSATCRGRRHVQTDQLQASSTKTEVPVASALCFTWTAAVCCVLSAHG